MTTEKNDPLREMLNQRLELQRYLIAKSWDDETFKQELLADPKAVVARELERDLPENVKVKVIEEEPDTIYLLIPQKPSQPEVEEELSEEALEAVAGGGSVVAIWNWKTSLFSQTTDVMTKFQSFNTRIGF